MKLNYVLVSLVCAGWLLVAGVSVLAGEIDSALYSQFDKLIAAAEAARLFESSDSGTLAWGESYVLSSYVKAYEATGDTKWFDRLTEHVDVMFRNLTRNQEGRLGWRTAFYSVGIARATASKDNRGDAKITPPEQRIYDVEIAPKMTSDRYKITFDDSEKFTVKNETQKSVIAKLDYKSGAPTDVIPGIRFAITGTPAKNDSFIIQTFKQKPFDYIVHDGMILTPVAQFIEIVYNNKALHEKYRAKATHYLKLMETELIPKWDKYWRDLSSTKGVYVFQNDESQSMPGGSLPHNQYLALGRTMLALYRITKKPFYKEKALKMGNQFKSNLQRIDNYYQWHYWDPASKWDEQWRRSIGVEDTSHGTIDIAFAIDAYHTGVVFSKYDMRRFANTFLEVMWNKSTDEPRIGTVINTPKGDSSTIDDWMLLAEFKPQVKSIAEKILKRRPDALGIAQLLYLQKKRY